MVTPAIAHYVWVGPDPMPDEYVENMDRFRELNPDWTVQVWVGPPTDMESAMREVLDGVPLFVQQTDVLRAWLICNYGGIYMDHDIWWLRPIEELRAIGPFVMRTPGAHYPCAGGVCGGPPGSSFFRAYAQWVKDIYHMPGLRNDRRIRFGPWAITKLVEAGEHPVRIAPPSWFHLFTRPSTVRRYRAAGPAERAAMISGWRDRSPDGIAPYGLHYAGNFLGVKQAVTT